MDKFVEEGEGKVDKNQVLIFAWLGLLWKIFFPFFILLVVGIEQEDEGKDWNLIFLLLVKKKGFFFVL